MKKYPVTPSARKFTAKPLTIWSARRWMAMKAWTSASAAPATTPVTMPHHQSPVLSAPRKPKNAPINIIPSRPMFMTPLRSEKIPPSAANVSGVAARSVAAMSADQTKAWSRDATSERVASQPSKMPSVATATAPQASRRLTPSRRAQSPARTPRPPTTTGTSGVRAVTGGRASQNASTPSPIPPHAR